MGMKRKSLFSSSQGVVRQEEKRDWQMSQRESGLLREPSCSSVSLSWLALHGSASLGPHWVIAPSRGSPKQISIFLLQIGTSEDQPSIVQAQRMAQPPGFLKITREHLLSGSPRLHPNLKKKKKGGGEGIQTKLLEVGSCGNTQRKTGKQSQVRNRRFPV